MSDDINKEAITDKVLGEVRKEIDKLLGSQDIEVDRDRLWEIEYLAIQLRLIDASVRANPDAMMTLIELRERLIDRRYPITDEYLKEKEKIDEQYESELVKLSKQAQVNEYKRFEYTRKLFEWMMKRIELQDRWVSRHSPLKVVARAFFGKLSERGGKDEKTA